MGKRKLLNSQNARDAFLIGWYQNLPVAIKRRSTRGSLLSKQVLEIIQIDNSLARLVD